MQDSRANTNALLDRSYGNAEFPPYVPEVNLNKTGIVAPHLIFLARVDVSFISLINNFAR